MTMTKSQFQQWLGTHGHPVLVDGEFGPKTRAATLAVFTNTCADAITDAEVMALANRLGCTMKQLKAVATVESGGAGFDGNGRPKILFERHIFHSLTGGVATPCIYSQTKGGGYKEDSWAKLTAAIDTNVDAAFASCSWGKFQVLGRHWNTLDYPSALEMAFSTTTGEGAHYEMLARYIEFNRMIGALKRLSTNPEDNRAFARGYNGPAYEKFDYHNKLARAMRHLGPAE